MEKPIEPGQVFDHLVDFGNPLAHPEHPVRKVLKYHFEVTVLVDPEEVDTQEKLIAKEEGITAAIEAITPDCSVDYWSRWWTEEEISGEEK